MTDVVATTLAEVAAALPGGGESRPGQQEMASAVGRAMAGGRHLVVQAGTGTGKSLAYLIPAALSGQRVVVATATKALQDQLATKDLPLVAAAVDGAFSFAVLKGRSNYLCRQRVSEIGGRGQQLSLPPGGADPPDADDPLTPAEDDGGGGGDPVDSGRLGEQVRRLVRWAEDTTTGDRAELEFEPHFRAWAMVSTTARECPGAFRCPSGHECFAEDARARAADADVVVVNTHLYGAHLASGGAVLPPHELVVFDEAHEVEEVMTDSLGVEIGPGRFRALAATARPLLDPGSAGAVDAADAVSDAGDLLQRVIRPLAGLRIPRRRLVGEDPGARPRSSTSRWRRRARQPSRSAWSSAWTTWPPSGLRSGAPPLPPHPGPRPGWPRSWPWRPVGSAGSSTPCAGPSGRPVTTSRRRPARDGTASCWPPATWPPTWPVSPPSPTTRWRGWTPARGHRACGSPPSTSARSCPSSLWDTVTGVLTSATVPLGLPERLGLPAGASDELDVGSPFDYPRPRPVVRGPGPARPPPARVGAGPPRRARGPDQRGRRTDPGPVHQLAGHARRRRRTVRPPLLPGAVPVRPAQAGADRGVHRPASRPVSSPPSGSGRGWTSPAAPSAWSPSTGSRSPVPTSRCCRPGATGPGPGPSPPSTYPGPGTLLAQGAGRLIRTADDRGVVAVLDSRLATARYRGALLARVPPMKRTDRPFRGRGLPPVASPADG